MEAVPKLPLISFELKVSSENTHFGPKLKQYIAEAYREDPESYSNEIYQLEALRSVAVRPTTDSAGLSALYKYFCQLRSLQSRFPMAKGQPAACSFSWKDLYANMTSSLSDIRVEMACILYNMGALHTQLGASEPRNTADSLKAACTHYQNAAWAFQYLKEQYPQPPGVDVSTEIMRLLQKICFAQAQECILEKSIQDTRKSSVVGAVATQVMTFYKNAITILGPSTGSDNIHEIIGTKLYNYWFRYLSFKTSYIGCIVNLYQGINAEEHQKFGERVAFYQQALERLMAAQKLAKYIEPTQVTLEALVFTNDVVEGKRKAAKNENEFIYHEEVPEKDLLVELKPVCLVKAIAINFNDPEISGPDIFSRLVPICTHEASSLYSEEKAKLLRSIVSQVESKNTELTEFMSSLQLDQLEVIESEQSLPQEIVDRCAAMNAKTEIIQSLVDSMNNLAEIISDVEHSLQEIKNLIQEETMKEKEYQKSMGPRPPSIVQTDLSREYHKYHEAHTRTNESNQVLHKAMTLHIANLQLLAQPLDALQLKIPSIDCIEGLDRATMGEMRRVVGKAREMQVQRDSLVQQLRDAVTADDVTALLLARPQEDTNALFAEQLEKHTPKVKIIEQNLAAQENIINRLTSLYASYGESRRLLTDVLRKRDGLINALITSYDTYEELLGKAQKGLEFYKKLAHNVAQLHARLRSTCQVNDEERQQQLAKVSKPATPAAAPAASAERSAAASPAPAVAPGRKLKDYLPYMQARGRRGAAPQAQVEQVPSDMYYPEAIYPTSIRPTPVGSEASDMAMQLPDGGILPMQGQPNPYERYASPYASSETDSYASQHNYAYPATSKDYEKPELNAYGYSAYTPQQIASQIPDQSQQIYSNPYYSATHNNSTISTDSQNTMQYQAGLNQANTMQNINQPNMNQPVMNQSNMNQPNINQPAMNQQNINQPNMNQPVMNQSNMNQPIANQSHIPNQYANPTQMSVNPNQYSNMGHIQANPNQAGYDAYSSGQAIAAPDVIPSAFNTDLSANFSQMQINVPKTEPPTTFGDYAQTYYSVQYPQANTPNSATYSHAPQSANTSMVSAPSDYSSLNYPYSDTTQLGQTPTSAPYSAEQYFATSGYANVSQGYGTYTQADSSVTSTSSVANAVSTSQSFGYPEADQSYANPALSHLDAFDKPIKSHAKREALPSSYGSNIQTYNSSVPEAASQMYSNSTDPAIQSGPSQMFGNQPGQNAISQAYVNQTDQTNIPNAQAQLHSNQNEPSNTQNIPTPQAFPNQTDQNYQSLSQSQNYSQGYQNHPGYTYDAATGNYAYTYGSQNAVSYDPSAANIHPQVPGKDQNWSAHGVYTNAGMCDTVQSPSLETPPQSDQSNQQIYYNSPYGYVMNTNQVSQMGQNPQATPTNYGADVNQSTYMQSGQHGHDTSVTYANNQVSTPKENISEPTFDQNHGSHGHDHYKSATAEQNISYEQDQNTANAVQNIKSPEPIPEPSTNQNVDSQMNNPPPQSNPVPEKQENIPEAKLEPSVFDLLSDIDFTVEQKPLMPEIKVPQISESAIIRPAVVPKVELVIKPPPTEEVIERPAKMDLFSDPSLLNKFTQEVKKLQKLTDSLNNTTADGLTVLDAKWKMFQDIQNKENMIRSKTIAMQHTRGNIVTEVVPFDDSRLTLKSDPDAYINASYYKQLASWCIPLVISKNPSESEYGIFWKAVLENKISCVVCLLSEIEMQGKCYWPTAKGHTLELDGLKVTLDEVNCNVHWTDRKLTVTSGKIVHSVTHYQINVFPAKIVCSPLVLLADRVLGETYAGRASNQLRGAWLTCGAGAGRCALLALLAALLCQLRAGHVQLCDILDAACAGLVRRRSNVLEDARYLADAYRTALFYAQGVLCSGTTSFNGEAVSLPSGASVLPPVPPAAAPSLQKTKFSRESFEEMKQSPGLKSGDMKDPLNFLDPLWSLKKK